MTYYIYGTVNKLPAIWHDKLSGCTGVWLKHLPSIMFRATHTQIFLSLLSHSYINKSMLKSSKCYQLLENVILQKTPFYGHVQSHLLRFFREILFRKHDRRTQRSQRAHFSLKLQFAIIYGLNIEYAMHNLVRYSSPRMHFIMKYSNKTSDWSNGTYFF